MEVCCNGDMKVELMVDLFHGADDDYELKIPVQTCSVCGKVLTPWRIDRD